jgi:hypothetical protein
MATELEKQPTADTRVNKPGSGTYGEKADLARLKQQLPPMKPQQEGGGPAGPAVNPPTVGLPGQPGRPSGGPAGVPAGILAPTSLPNVPLGTPLQQGGAPGGQSQNAQEARIGLLQQLANSQDVSEETRDWAKAVLALLTSE